MDEQILNYYKWRKETVVDYFDMTRQQYEEDQETAYKMLKFIETVQRVVNLAGGEIEYEREIGTNG